MLTDLQICNLGLALNGAGPIRSINPPKTSLEVHVAAIYKQALVSELTKRRWVFATVFDYELTASEVLENVDKPYVYNLPVDCLRPVRQKRTEWFQTGRTLRSDYDTLVISYVKQVEEKDFDPLFVDVLAARIAVNTAEHTTQSSPKKRDVSNDYDLAVQEAGRVNAFIIGPEDIQDNDDVFSWISSRYA